jgi:hypothetical protein
MIHTRSVRRPRLTLALAAALVAFGLPPSNGFADDQPKVESSCLSYDSAYENAPLFTVKPDSGDRRVYFYADAKQCPANQPCPSRQKSFLVNGDVVFAGPSNNGFRCAYYGSAKGKIIAGFIPIENLDPLKEDDSLSSEFVTGHWKYEDDTIDIKPGPAGKVSGEGQAYYRTDTTENDGAFSANAPLAPGQKELVFKESDTSCVVKLRRRGPYLVASDNGNCGGMNVSFEGIYTRLKSK